MRSESPLVHDTTARYLRDLSEHLVVSLELIEFYQTMIMDLYNVYNASISNRANEIMKTLTIFAAIFIPLTFIAGIYGMNFEVIPELSWKWGYLYVWILIIGIGIAILFYFKKRRWL